MNNWNKKYLSYALNIKFGHNVRRCKLGKFLMPNQIIPYSNDDMYVDFYAMLKPDFKNLNEEVSLMNSEASKKISFVKKPVFINGKEMGALWKRIR